MTATAEPATDLPPSQRAHPVRRAAAATLWLALSILLVLALRELPWREALVELRRSRPVWLLAALACNLALLPLWAREWSLLVPKSAGVRWRRMFEITAVTSAITNTVPFVAGELSAVALLVTRAGLTRAGALTVIAMDQLLVGVAKLALLGAVALLMPLPAWLRAGTLGLVAAVAGLAAFVLVVAYRGRVHARGPGTAQRWLNRLLAAAAEVDEHLVALWRAGAVPKVILLAIGKKMLEVLAVLAVQRAVGIELPFATGLLVVAALGISTLVSVAPANLGVYEATVFVVYRWLGVPPDLAIAASVLQHMCFLLPLVLPGWLVLSVRQLGAGGTRSLRRDSLP